MRATAADLEDTTLHRDLFGTDADRDDLKNVVAELRASFQRYWLDGKEPLKYERQVVGVKDTGKGRFVGIPPKLWLASLVDPRMKNANSFISKDDRAELWKKLEVEVFKRAKEAAIVKLEEIPVPVVVDVNPRPKKRRKRKKDPNNFMSGIMDCIVVDEVNAPALAHGK